LTRSLLTAAATWSVHREFAQARRGLKVDGHGPLWAITDYDEALMLVRAGSAAAARTGALLAGAMAAFRSLGMAAYEQRAADLGAAAAGAEAPPRPGSPPGRPRCSGSSAQAALRSASPRR
jgi:hypothetical protein